jgi:hypothetical protein
VGAATPLNGGSATGRNYPDVAAVANKFLGYTNQSWGCLSGTSFSSPLWAGFVALVNEQAEANGYPPVGFLNPALYAIGFGPISVYTNCFHDVTVGNNRHDPSCTDPNVTGCSGTTNGFDAVAGYDLCTGWGTPNGAQLINALVGVLTQGEVSSSSNSFSLTVNVDATTTNNTSWNIFRTDDLSLSANNWTNVGSVPGAAGAHVFTDTNILGATNRFYRAACGPGCWQPSGYVTTQVLGYRWAQLANQLDAPANTLDGLFNPMPNTAYPFLPNGTQLSVQNSDGSWTFNTYIWYTNGNAGYWTNAVGTPKPASSVILGPGAGFWLSNASPSSIWITFAGLVRQGTLSNPIQTTNQCLYSSILPQAGGLTSSLGYTPTLKDRVFIWNAATNGYYSSTVSVLLTPPSRRARAG